MDGKRFDAWVKRVPGASRRGLLRGLVGTALATAFGGVSGKDAAGEGVCDKGCGTICEPVAAQLLCSFRNPNCVCVKSTSNANLCADLARAACPAAGAANDCEQDSDCGLNEVCIRTAGGVCCSDPAQAQVNICIPRCLNLSTAAHSQGGESVIDGVRKRL